MGDKSNAALPSVTNADRIRAMSDEELARLLASIKDCHHCPIGVVGKQCYEIYDTPESLLDWLKQPAPEEAEQNV